MSLDADPAATVALFDSFSAQGYCALAAAVVFIYDTFVTFDREVACFWTAKWTGAPLLFFANKWFSLTFYVMVLVGWASFPSDSSCTAFQLALLAISVLQYFPASVFSALRAYVLTRSKLLGFLVQALSLAPVGANLVPFGYQVTGWNFPPFGCSETDNTTEAIALKLVIISRVPLIISDMLLIYITWTKISSREALRDVRQLKRPSLSNILFCNGTIYFVVLFVLNVVHLVLSTTALAGYLPSHGSLVTTFTAPITAILISRFLLELQEANQMVVFGLDPDDPLHSSRDPYDTPSFISSLGAFINPDLTLSSDVESEMHARSEEAGKEEIELYASQTAPMSSSPV